MLVYKSAYKWEEGHSHSIYQISSNTRRTPVPRHREIPNPLALEIRVGDYIR